MRFAQALSLSGLSIFSLGLFACFVPPAWANDYENCTSRLLDAGIAPATAAASCARVLYPPDLATCVSDIQRNTPIAASDALKACVQVRRPVDLGMCVLNIHRQTTNPATPQALDYCRRSLLPIAFSRCVVGISRKVTLTSTQAMDTCIDASDRPSDVFPTLIPLNP